MLEALESQMAVVPEQENQQSIRLEYANITNRCAPVSALPNEILASIFEMGYPYGLHIKASHVMRHWRDVVINMPILWTSISLRGIESLDQAETYLKRSQNCSLDIQFDFPRLSNKSSAMYTECYMACCTPHVERWRTVVIEAYGVRQIRNILHHFTSLSAPRLQSFMLHNTRNRPPWLEVHSSSPVRVFTGGADALKRLDFSQFSMAWCWPPLTAVTQLDFCWIEPVLLLNHFHDALRAMPCLARLKIQGQATEFLLDPVPSITIPSLEWLYIDCAGPRKVDYTAALFATLCTPSITSLTLESMNKDTSVVFGRHLQIPPHIPRYPMLQFIGFEDASCMADDLDLFSLLSTITHLSLQTVGNFVEQLSAKSSLPGGNLVMPYLCTVTIKEPCHDDFASVCELISIRKSINLPITTLRLTARFSADLHHINWLRDNVCLDILNRKATVFILMHPADFGIQH